jgi:uncharacterized RDD family membrane protein YckC
MICHYCGAPNPEDDHRCHRCGRRLATASHQGGSARPQPLRTSPIPKSMPAEQKPPPPPAPLTANRLRPRQRTLFPSPIIRFEEIASGREAPPQPPPSNQARPPAGPASPPPLRKKPVARRKVSPNQESFNFSDPPPPVERPITQPRPEPTRYCERPVAGLLHRMLAAFLDASMVTIAVAIILVTFYLFGGRLSLDDRLALAIVGAAALALLAFYKILGILWEQDSPGMVWVRLRLVNFDGLRPTRRQRVSRTAGVLLSLAAAGFGFIWALADQEKLTWHDHISKTFPSPRL